MAVTNLYSYSFLIIFQNPLPFATGKEADGYTKEKSSSIFLLLIQSSFHFLSSFSINVRIQSLPVEQQQQVISHFSFFTGGWERRRQERQEEVIVKKWQRIIHLHPSSSFPHSLLVKKGRNNRKGKSNERRSMKVRVQGGKVFEPQLNFI